MVRPRAGQSLLGSDVVVVRESLMLLHRARGSWGEVCGGIHYTAQNKRDKISEGVTKGNCSSTGEAGRQGYKTGAGVYGRDDEQAGAAG